MTRLAWLMRRRRELEQEIAAECYSPRKQPDGMPHRAKISDPTFDASERIGKLAVELRRVNREIQEITGGMAKNGKRREK